MFNNSGITKTVGYNTTQILFDVDNQKSVGVVVDATSNKANGEAVNGHTILRAGTPLTGKLTTRETAFTAAKVDGSDVVGILLHDVDLGVVGSEKNANGTLLIWGFVNLDRVGTKANSLLVAAVQTGLAGKIWFLK